MKIAHWVIGLTVVIAMYACDRRGQSPVEPSSPRPEALGSSFVQEQAMARVGKGIALALAQSEVRQRVLDDMRDSPFPEHSLHLGSYLRGPRGHLVSEAAGRHVGLSSREFVSMVPHTPAMSMSVSSALDRVRWEGSNDVVVVASARTSVQRFNARRLTGWRTDGTAVSVPITMVFRHPIISILPVEDDVFGADPELVRAGAPVIERGTISTRELEFGTLCDPESVDCEPDIGGGGALLGPGTRLDSACSYTDFDDVTSINDRDGDGIKDYCEHVFATAFEPFLVLHNNEHYDSREPYWSVEIESSNGYPRIAYLLSYYYDGGAFSHRGDSEFVLVTIKGTHPSTWHVWSVTTSAHWGACCTGDETATHVGSGLEYRDGHHPYIYVSKDHHANYTSEAKCDARIGDSCSSRGGGNEQPAAFGPDYGENIGNLSHRYDIDSRHTGQPDCAWSRVDRLLHPGDECFFTGAYFDGWYSGSDGATPYKDILWAYGFN